MKSQNDSGPTTKMRFLYETAENRLMTDMHPIKIPQTHHRVGKRSATADVADNLHAIRPHS